jgi:hypothetical protein
MWSPLIFTLPYPAETMLLSAYMPLLFSLKSLRIGRKLPGAGLKKIRTTRKNSSQVVFGASAAIRSIAFTSELSEALALNIMFLATSVK